MLRFAERLRRLERAVPQRDLRLAEFDAFMREFDWAEYERVFMLTLNQFGVEGLIVEFAHWRHEGGSQDEP